jgi:hypothetical protein
LFEHLSLFKVKERATGTIVKILVSVATIEVR